MIFQARHYEAVAKTLRESEAPLYQINDAAVLLAPMFEADNPRFNRERFLAACCPTEKEEDAS